MNVKAKQNNIDVFDDFFLVKHEFDQDEYIMQSDPEKFHKHDNWGNVEDWYEKSGQIHATIKCNDCKETFEVLYNASNPLTETYKEAYGDEK